MVRKIERWIESYLKKKETGIDRQTDIHSVVGDEKTWTAEDLFRCFMGNNAGCCCCCSLAFCRLLTLTGKMCTDLTHHVTSNFQTLAIDSAFEWDNSQFLPFLVFNMIIFILIFTFFYNFFYSCFFSSPFIIFLSFRVFLVRVYS